MSPKMQILLPVPERQGTTELALAPRLPGLQGKTIGLISNSWRSVEIMFDVFRQQLAAQYEVKAFIKKLATTSGPVVDRDYEDLVARADAVICGLAN